LRTALLNSPGPSKEKYISNVKNVQLVRTSCQPRSRRGAAHKFCCCL
jgi:hypothetical protein